MLFVRKAFDRLSIKQIRGLAFKEGFYPFKGVKEGQINSLLAALCIKLQRDTHFNERRMIICLMKSSRYGMDY